MSNIDLKWATEKFNTDHWKDSEARKGHIVRRIVNWELGVYSDEIIFLSKERFGENHPVTQKAYAIHKAWENLKNLESEFMSLYLESEDTLADEDKKVIRNKLEE